MSWIDTISVDAASGRLKELYDRVQSPTGHVDNVLMVHSLRPNSLQAHLSLYKAVLHSRPSGLLPRERELVAVCVSQLNGCDYCVAHHTAGLARHVGGIAAARDLAAASIGRGSRDVLTQRESAFCTYARKLTQSPQSMCVEDLAELRQLGTDDATILDLNQIVAYFAYVNRTVLGLGVAADGEPLGLHPSERRDDFAHG